MIITSSKGFMSFTRLNALEGLFVGLENDSVTKNARWPTLADTLGLVLSILRVAQNHLKLQFQGFQHPILESKGTAHTIHMHTQAKHSHT